MQALCIKENEMTTYLVRLKGKNFLMDGVEGPKKKRFYVTRLVEAENPSRAETPFEISSFPAGASHSPAARLLEETS